MDLGFYFKLLLRRLHYVLFFLAIGTAAGLSLAMLLPPSYSASATLLVESEQIPGELAATTVQTEAAEALEIIRQRILTRARLLELANEFEIYGLPSGEQRRSMTPDDVVSDLRSRIAVRTTVGGDRRTTGATIVTVGFSAPDGRTAADVAIDFQNGMAQIRQGGVSGA